MFSKEFFVMKKALVLAAVFGLILSCSDQGNSPDLEGNKSVYPDSKLAGQPVILSILPVESAGAMYERFVPLKYHLENVLKRPVIIKVERDYETAIHEIGSGKVHLAFLDPAAYCEARNRFKNKVTPLIMPIGKEGAKSRSVLVVKDGSAVEKAADVKGKRVALGAQQASFSYLIPLAMMNAVGIGIKDFSRLDLLQQEDRVALSVLSGYHDVGGMSEGIAMKYNVDGLKIITASEAIPAFLLCASDMLADATKKDIVKSLTSLSLKDRGIIASIDKDMEGFAVAGDRDVDVIRIMIKNVTGLDYMEYGHKTIKVAVLPLYSAITLYDRYEPLMRYLSEKTGYEFKLVIPKDFEDFMRVVKSGNVDFSYQNPYIFALI
ncbi:MAG: PhnD/SsuA/transferrin family substrate-binding protein, partial [Nitrospirae bacterium]|nr:PhnD/SsuA/transferrin family substrate-binding protein [Nitrospirota bacterium]